MSDSGQKYSIRRSRLLSVFTIKTHLKFKFVLFCVALLLTSAVFSILGTKIAIYQMIAKGLVTDDVFIYKLGLMSNLIIAIQFLILSVSFFLFLLVAHIITGPIFNMEKVFDLMKKGDISMTVRFRKGDDLQLTATKLNDALTNLRTALEIERQAEEKLIANVARISQELIGNNQTQLGQELDHIVGQHKNIPRTVKTN